MIARIFTIDYAPFLVATVAHAIVELTAKE